jgi:hypothetical protein
VLDPSRLRSGASIANDLHLSGEKILALSGAAGGAHDNLIASAVQSQVLALLGAAVPAQEYCCGIPDQIVVQTDTGLGAQASETRTNLERLSPASLWVLKTGEQRLDPERRSELGRALDAANQLQIPVLFVSSDPQLLNLIATNEPAIAIARRFSTLEDGRPGYRLEPGISWGAERLAAGDSSLTRQELEALLEQRGALQRSLQRWEHN